MSSHSQNRFVAVVLAMVGLASFATAQAVTLQEQLNAEYKPVQMAGNGTVVVEPGTLLTVQKGGIISVPWKAVVHCAAKFQDNALHPSTGFCAGMMKSVSQYLQKGNKVYPLKLEVNLDKAKISFQVVACDSCNGVDPATGMKGEVVFQFARGYLEKANAGEVEDLIGKVFAISNDDDQQAQGGQGGDPGQQGNQQASQQAPAQQQQEQQAEPQTIQLGMSTDQVQGALGKPDKIFNLGAKQIYVYKDVKVTFLNGKVSDVQ
ncbi:MAG TPA: hypothetical protein VMQ17_02590 [Candidatus Sulfotelmatobacter sp.]|nr:hypothetical protein [Candidatus Sulfotelmatobacter sp.]